MSEPRNDQLVAQDHKPGSSDADFVDCFFSGHDFRDGRCARCGTKSAATPSRLRRMNSRRRRKLRLRNVEQVRAVAFNAYLDGMHFHEVAMRDPFEAEREYQALARKITDLLGPPKGVRSYVVR